MNIYDGIAKFNDQGDANIKLADYFDALNKDFKYEYFPLDGPEPNLYISLTPDKAKNEFTISGGTPGHRVSWQITGVRHDPFILAHPIQVEVEKSDTTDIKKGEYLYKGYEKK